MKHLELTDQIIGSAFDVYNKLGTGFVDSVYQNCLLIELNKQGIKARAKRPLEVYYDNQIVGEFTADLIVEENVIVELLAIPEILPAHEVQLLNLLTAANLEVGLIINFTPTSVEFKRQERQPAPDRKVGTKPLGKPKARRKSKVQ